MTTFIKIIAEPKEAVKQNRVSVNETLTAPRHLRAAPGGILGELR